MSKENQFDKMLGQRVASRHINIDTSAGQTASGQTQNASEDVNVAAPVSFDNSSTVYVPQTSVPARTVTRITKTLSLQPQIHDSLLTWAKEEHRTFNAFVNLVLEEYLREHGRI